MPFVNNLFLFTLRIGWKMEDFIHQISKSLVHNNDCLPWKFSKCSLSTEILFILLLLLCWHLAPCLLLILVLHRFSTTTICRLSLFFASLCRGNEPSEVMHRNSITSHESYGFALHAHEYIVYLCVRVCVVCVLIMQTWYPLNRQTGIEFKITNNNNTRKKNQTKN